MPTSTVHTNCKATALPGNAPFLGSYKKKAKSPKSTSPTNLYPLGDSPNDVHFVYSSSTMTGPWSLHFLTQLQTNINAFDSWNCNKTNLSPVMLPNNTVIMSYRSKSCVAMSKQSRECGKGCQNIGIAVSDDGPMGNYVLRPRKIDALSGDEDPFLWKNPRGWLMVMHGKTVCGSSQQEVNTCGALGYSLDSYTWYLSPFPAYTGTVTFDPSVRTGTESLYLRQQPKILFSNEGVPLALYNAGQRYTEPYTRNFAFAFNVSDMRNYEAPPPCPPTPFINICTSFVRSGYTYNHTQNGCEMLGAANCIWCGNQNLCLPGSDPRICSAPSIAVFYAHC